MNRKTDDSDLEDVIRRAAASDSAPFDEARWKQEHPEEIALIASWKPGHKQSSTGPALLETPSHGTPAADGPTLRLAPEASYGSAERAQQGALQDPGRRRTWRFIMHGISLSAEAANERVKKNPMVRYAVAAAVILAVLFGAKALFQQGQGPGKPFTLLAQAYAAEADLFAGQQVIHLRNQILVAPVAEETWAQSRWLPLVSLEATGKTRLHQIVLPGEVNKGYTVEDECWYDPPTGRFVRLLTCDGRPIYANAYDGASIHTLATAAGEAEIVSHPTDKGFQPPQNPAEILGIGAGLQCSITPKDDGTVQDAGSTLLEDGTEGHLVRLGVSAAEDAPQAEAYWLVTVRVANSTVENMEWRHGSQSLLVIRRAQAGPEQTPTVGWNLAGVARRGATAVAANGPTVRADMVVPGISVEQMVKRAGFATYVFAKDPEWAGRPAIIDEVLDVASPPKRMFTINYRAKDGRHVVLVQSPTYNATFGPLMRQGTLVYSSPAGIKVWGGPRGPWLAQILLKSARYYIQDGPGKEVTGYILETPEGTYPALAINGKIAEEELHALVDSLRPAKEAGQGDQAP